MHLRTLALLAALMVLGAGPAPAQTTSAGAIQVEGPSIRDAVGRSGIAVALMRITNAADEPDRLYEASSPLAERVELQRAGIEDGILLTRQVRTIEVPGGGALDLSEDGYHILLLGLTEPLQRGMRVPLRLRFAEAGEVAIEAEVTEIAWNPPGH